MDVYGVILLEQDLVEEAASVHNAELGLDKTLPRALQHPNNVWGLYGYHDCMIRLGRIAKQGSIETQLTLVMAIADVPIKSSCCCRRL
jgi:hypothetical protein